MQLYPPLNGCHDATKDAFGRIMSQKIVIAVYKKLDLPISSTEYNGTILKLGDSLQMHDKVLVCGKDFYLHGFKPFSEYLIDGEAQRIADIAVKQIKKHVGKIKYFACQIVETTIAYSMQQNSDVVRYHFVYGIDLSYEQTKARKRHNKTKKLLPRYTSARRKKA